MLQKYGLAVGAAVVVFSPVVVMMLTLVEASAVAVTLVVA